MPDYNKLATKESVDKTIKALGELNVEAMYVENGKAALEKIKELIPPGASVMNGSSVTLEQIGYVDYLKEGKHGWNNLHEAIIAESDPAKKSALRKQALLSEYYLGSVHGLAQTGQFVIASNTGSQLPHVVYSSKNIIFVVSTKKIVPTLPEAYERLMKHVVPLEEKHMQEKYNSGTFPSKIVTWNRENPSIKRKVRMLLVNEDLGF